MPRVYTITVKLPDEYVDLSTPIEKEQEAANNDPYFIAEFIEASHNDPEIELSISIEDVK